MICTPQIMMVTNGNEYTTILVLSASDIQYRVWIINILHYWFRQRSKLHDDT